MGWINEIKNIPVQYLEKRYSQNGEEHVVNYILNNIPIKHKFLVDLGANDGFWLSNTRLLVDEGWSSLLVDNQDKPDIVKWFITKDNIISLFEMYKVPLDFDFLNIDLDGNDYWILDKILEKYKPALILSEFNAEHPAQDSKTIEYDDNFSFDNYSDWYGYTFRAGIKLAKKHGYRIIHMQSDLNLYYLREDLIPKNVDITINFKQRRWWGGVNPNAKWVNI